MSFDMFIFVITQLTKIGLIAFNLHEMKTLDRLQDFEQIYFSSGFRIVKKALSFLNGMH